MNVSKQVLAFLEGDETQKVEQVKDKLHLQTERNARVVLHILETSPDKFEQKIEKEIAKLEDKLDKEHKKEYRRMISYNNENTVNSGKINEIKYEIGELQQLLK